MYPYASIYLGLCSCKWTLGVNPPFHHQGCCSSLKNVSLFVRRGTRWTSDQGWVQLLEILTVHQVQEATASMLLPKFNTGSRDRENISNLFRRRENLIRGSRIKLGICDLLLVTCCRSQFLCFVAIYLQEKASMLMNVQKAGDSVANMEVATLAL